jgi:hypothetical protein
MTRFALGAKWEGPVVTAFAEGDKREARTEDPAAYPVFARKWRRLIAEKSEAEFIGE